LANVQTKLSQISTNTVNKLQTTNNYTQQANPDLVASYDTQSANAPYISTNPGHHMGQPL